MLTLFFCLLLTADPTTAVTNVMDNPKTAVWNWRDKAGKVEVFDVHEASAKAGWRFVYREDTKALVGLPTWFSGKGKMMTRNTLVECPDLATVKAEIVKRGLKLDKRQVEQLARLKERPAAVEPVPK